MTGWISTLQKKQGKNKQQRFSWDILTPPSPHTSLSLPLAPSCLILPLCLQHPNSIAKFTLASSQLIVIPCLPSSVFVLLLPSAPPNACVLSSVDVIIWAFVFVWQVSRAFYLRYFHSIFTTKTHTHRQTQTHTHRHRHTPTRNTTQHNTTWTAHCSVMCC